MAKKERSGIVFLIEQMTIAEELLDDWELGKLYRALKAFSVEGVLPQMEGESRQWCAVFNLMRSAQQKSIEKYEEMCARNQAIAQKRSMKAGKDDEASRVVTERTNLIKSSQIKSNQINASGGFSPALDGQEGVTDDDDGYWLN